MSRYIVLRKWSGDDAEDVSIRLAKVFRMTSVRSEMIIQDVSAGRPWRFEHPVSDMQGEHAGIYLKTLGFEVALKTREEILAEAADFARKREQLRMDTSSADVASAEESGTAAWLNRLKQVLTPRSSAEKFSILDMISFLQGKRSAPAAEPMPVETAPEPQLKPAFLEQLSFLNRWKKTPATETTAEPAGGKVLERLSASGETIRATFARWFVSAQGRERLPSPFPPKAKPVEAAVAKDKSRRQSMALFGLLAWLALPAAFSYWIGTQVEARFNLLPELVSRSGSAMLVNKRFEKGWFRSSGENIIRFPGFPFYLTLDHEVIHGPIDLNEFLAGNYDKALINFRVDSRVSLTYAGANLENIPPMKMQTIFYLNGEAESRFEMPPHQNPAPVQINWQGLRGALSLNAEISNLRGSMEILPLKMSLGGNSFDAQLAKGSMNIQANPAEPTTMGLDVSRIEMKDDKKSTALQGYKLYYMVKETAGAREYVLNQSFDKLTSGEDNYGPGTLNLRARNLDMAAAGRLREEFAKNRDSQGETPETIAAREQKIGKLIRAFLDKKPALEIVKLNFKTSEGEVDGKLKLGFDGSVDAQDISSAFQNSEGEAAISIPIAFLTKPHALSDKDPSVHVEIKFPAEDWEKDGYLIRKDQNYEAMLSVKQGKFVLNGKPVDPFPKTPDSGVAAIAPAPVPAPKPAPEPPQP